jgi:multisubunit Na+/H+ antiporter MnhF subunit
MIDPWLFAACCLVILSVFAFLRVFFRPAFDDRFVAMNTAITLAAAASLSLSISWGNIVILDISIVLIALCYAGIIIIARLKKGEKV